MVALGFMLALAGIIVLIIGVAQAVQNHYYATGIDTTMGTVIHKQRRKVNKTTSYELTVTYMVDGTEYQRVVGALMSEFDDIHEGEKVKLVYKTANPKKALRPEGLKPQFVRILLILGAVLTVVGTVMFFSVRLINLL